MDSTTDTQTTAIPRRAWRPWIVGGASVGVGLILYGAGATLELLGGDARYGALPLAAKVCGVAGPLPVVVWQAMIVSGRWRWVMGVAAVIAIFSFGRWLQGLFGLDPPYADFVLGMVLELEAMTIGAAMATAFIASMVSAVVRRR